MVVQHYLGYVLKSSRSKLFTVAGDRNSREENIFGAATADSGRDCAINSFVLNRNLIVNVADVRSLW